VGAYDLVVGGVDAADIEVKVDDDEEGETEGKVRFDSRFARGNKLPLTFEPLCQSLAVAQAGTTVPRHRCLRRDPGLVSLTRGRIGLAGD